MRMPSKELAINLAKVLKDEKFAIVENSVVKHLLTGEVIPRDSICSNLIIKLENPNP